MGIVYGVYHDSSRMWTLSRRKIDMDALPLKCGKCNRPVDKSEWVARIIPGAILMGLKIKKGVSFKCPDCENQMYSGVLE